MALSIVGFVVVVVCFLGFCGFFSVVVVGFFVFLFLFLFLCLVFLLPRMVFLSSTTVKVTLILQH